MPGERLAQKKYVLGQVALFDELLRPKHLQQFILPHHSLPVIDQAEQRSKVFRLSGRDPLRQLNCHRTQSISYFSNAV